MRSRRLDLSSKISDSSERQYLLTASVSRNMAVDMTFVRQSANCAPECTHLIDTPSEIKSFIARACNCVRNSAQLGGAFRVTRSNRGLQSVAATEAGHPSLTAPPLCETVEAVRGLPSDVSTGPYH